MICGDDGVDQEIVIFFLVVDGLLFYFHFDDQDLVIDDFFLSVLPFSLHFDDQHWQIVELAADDHLYCVHHVDHVHLDVYGMMTMSAVVVVAVMEKMKMKTTMMTMLRRMTMRMMNLYINFENYKYNWKFSRTSSKLNILNQIVISQKAIVNRLLSFDFWYTSTFYLKG